MFSPLATPGHLILGVSHLVFGITGGIFVVVASLLVYVLVRFRQHKEDPDASHEPQQIYGSTRIELSWTVISTLIVVMLFLATVRIIFATQDAAKPQNALEVDVIGHQFWWEYRYPKLGIVTANELHIPVSDPKHPAPTYLTLTSADVDHSFWVPRLAGKIDAIPNRINTMSLDPQQPGIFIGHGTQHPLMLPRVYADTPEQFAAWIAHQKQPAVNDRSATEGWQVFEHNACISCHSVGGTVATGRFGPDLTHFASRSTLASGAVPISPANVRAFIENPGSFKPGVLMPPMHLNQRDLDAVTAYLMTLK
jgi:cytochrome c oxidase subunit 2